MPTVLDPPIKAVAPTSARVTISPITIVLGQNSQPVAGARCRYCQASSPLHAEKCPLIAKVVLG